MKLFQVLAFSLYFISSVFAQGLQARLNQLGLDGYARMLEVYNPELLQEICTRNDIIVWAPGNARVAARLAATKKRTTQGAATSGNTSGNPPRPNRPIPSQRRLKRRLPDYPNTNFETVLTFLNDSDFVNLGPDQPVRFSRSFAAPLDGAFDSVSAIEVLGGLGDTQKTLRGPFKFTNGVIYEVTDFFTFPELFTATMKHINLAQVFFNIVVSAGKLSLFEDSPAVTIFAPIDGKKTSRICNPEQYIIGPNFLAYSHDLLPGNTVVTKSGDAIKVTWASDGGRLVNGRKIVKANVPIKNGVIHFIDGPLF